MIKIKPYKFLLDENVRIELRTFLQTHGCDTKLLLKTISDEQVAAISKKQKRILITNDSDFLEYSQDQIYSVVFLKFPQNALDTLLTKFENLLKSIRVFKGKSIVLSSEKIDIRALP